MVTVWGSAYGAAGAASQAADGFSVFGQSGSRLSFSNSVSHGGRAPPGQEPPKTIRSVSQVAEPTTHAAKSHLPSR